MHSNTSQHIHHPHIQPLMVQHPGTVPQQDNAFPHTPHVDKLPSVFRGLPMASKLYRHLQHCQMTNLERDKCGQICQGRIQRLIETIPNHISTCIVVSNVATPYWPCTKVTTVISNGLVSFTPHSSCVISFTSKHFWVHHSFWQLVCVRGLYPYI